MTDWQIGDLAVCVQTGQLKCPCGNLHRGRLCPPKGAAVRVLGLMREGDYYGDETTCLILLCDGGRGLADRFRKIRPDEREACEPEFVTLLKRSKRKVSA